MLDDAMRRCIDICLRCHRTCLTETSQHCLEAGGAHTAPPHLRLMLACAEICRTSAAMMMIGVEQHRLTCGVCAEICEACARSCEEVGGMEECVRTCRECAESCRQMAA
jgi:hypothetical protein